MKRYCADRAISCSFVVVGRCGVPSQARTLPLIVRPQDSLLPSLSGTIESTACVKRAVMLQVHFFVSMVQAAALS